MPGDFKRKKPTELQKLLILWLNPILSKFCFPN
jgi:hypothetical protein